MIVYFTASIKGKGLYEENYLKIIDILKSKNYSVISDHIIKNNPAKIQLESKDERLAFQKQLDEWINSAEVVVAETSFPSISVGFEISLALARGKPVLILYAEGHPPSLLAHHENEKLVCEKYTFDTVADIIEDFLNYAKGTEESRFTFFITSQIASYLEEVSKNEKLPKSVYLRKLIE